MLAVTLRTKYFFMKHQSHNNMFYGLATAGDITALNAIAKLRPRDGQEYSRNIQFF